MLWDYLPCEVQAVIPFVAKVLSALGMNLKNKSEAYNDPYLAAVFMLNNFNYVQLKLDG